ncbi:hypothetical protein E2562_023529 [Oryza meyeriana var. granulata]|uniref:F-box domain-containing protein n=1 Tax=Oryza meyeriana var. granulata TaxID=110450 RepID=A0A6G1E0Z3_9ORYZ|nr:hypothetical protein E2562_023529 [Oryza meyeriana var. granulata]
MDMEARVDWEALPGDLVGSIGELLSVSSRIRCRAVCRSWRAAIRPEAAMPSPWVVIPRVIGCSDSFTFLSIPTMKSLQWTPPGGERMRCVGSNAGWLAVVTLVDLVVRMSLVNPLTDARIDIPTSFCRLGWALDPYLEELTLDSTIRKVAFAVAPSPNSAHDYTIAAVLVGGRKVAYGRGRGGVSDPWLGVAEIPRPPGGDGMPVQVDVAYHDGKLYYMEVCGQVWVVDMAAPSPSPAPFANLVPPVVPHLAHRRRGFYLACSDDGALHVLWTRSSHDGTNRDDPDMLVRRYDPVSSAWEKLKPDGLGGAAFLIGDINQSVSVRDRDGVGSCLCPDSVYFTNTPLCLLLDHRLYCYRDHGAWVFDVATGHIDWQITADYDHPAPALSRPEHWCRSLWLTPRAQ